MAIARRVCCVWMTLVGLGCTARHGTPAVETNKAKIISGDDGRLDMFEVTDPEVQRNADGVGMIVFTGELNRHDGVVDIPMTTLKDSVNLCAGERYASQAQAAQEWCTAYLVGPRLVATAGHCTTYAAVGQDVSQYSLIFGFRMLDADHAHSVFAASEVYTATSVAALCNDSEDCTVLQLDRPVTNHNILKLRRSGEPTTSDSVYMLGYPYGLPLKYAASEPFFRVAGENLITRLDTSPGNSGSPWFNASTHLVEGTLSGTSASGDTPTFDTTATGCTTEHRAVPDDNYFSTAWSVASLRDYVPAYCSSDASGWAGCSAADGCGVCSSQLEASRYDRYLANHPNCHVDSSCSGALTNCSEACPSPTAADASGDAGGGGGGGGAGTGAGGAGSSADRAGSSAHSAGSGSDSAGSGSDSAGNGSDSAGSGGDSAGSGGDSAGNGSDSAGNGGNGGDSAGSDGDHAGSAGMPPPIQCGGTP